MKYKPISRSRTFSYSILKFTTKNRSIVRFHQKNAKKEWRTLNRSIVSVIDAGVGVINKNTYKSINKETNKFKSPSFITSLRFSFILFLLISFSLPLLLVFYLFLRQFHTNTSLASKQANVHVFFSFLRCRIFYVAKGKHSINTEREKGKK